ncbi:MULTISPECIES: hypothetical protein [Actinomadura]|uniref:Uncharacterized protein n=1 Tax=Actinomadura yumaensis TaxID=111807 RepID=A0ABW2CKX1_9ACTN|nr:hypothetical protein [Actinomadura sp. J1-007]
MSDERPSRPENGKWRSLPPRTPLDRLVAGHEVPPKPQVIAEPGNRALDEATRYPG